MSPPGETGPGSVSKVRCNAEVRGRGKAALALYKHLAPLTVSAVLRELPLQSRVSLQQGMACMFTTIRVGVEKPRMTFERGDVAFLPSGGLLCVFVKGAKSDRPLNPVGKVEGGLEVFDSLRAGDVATLTAEPE